MDKMTRASSRILLLMLGIGLPRTSAFVTENADRNNIDLEISADGNVHEIHKDGAHIPVASGDGEGGDFPQRHQSIDDIHGQVSLVDEVGWVFAPGDESARIEFRYKGSHHVYFLQPSAVFAEGVKVKVHRGGSDDEEIDPPLIFSSGGHDGVAQATAHLGEDGTVSGLFQAGDHVIELRPSHEFTKSAQGDLPASTLEEPTGTTTQVHMARKFKLQHWLDIAAKLSNLQVADNVSCPGIVTHRSSFLDGAEVIADIITDPELPNDPDNMFDLDHVAKEEKPSDEVKSVKLPSLCVEFFKDDCEMADEEMPEPTCGDVTEKFDACCEKGGHKMSTCKAISADAFGSYESNQAVNENQCHALVELFGTHVDLLLAKMGPNATRDSMMQRANKAIVRAGDNIDTNDLDSSVNQKRRRRPAPRPTPRPGPPPPPPPWRGDKWAGKGCYNGDSKLNTFTIGVEADLKAFQQLRSNVQYATTVLTQAVKEASAIYEAQMNVKLQIGHMKIWASANGAPSYATNCGPAHPNNHQSHLLNTFKSSYRGPRMAAEHLMTGCGRTHGVIGLAWVGTICGHGVNKGVNRIGVGGNMPLWRLFAHELGHNFGGHHSFERGQGRTGGIMDYGDGRKNGVHQFNSQYRKAEMCRKINGVVNRCNGKFQR